MRGKCQGVGESEKTRALTHYQYNSTCQLCSMGRVARNVDDSSVEDEDAQVIPTIGNDDDGK